jgi:anti-sigma regulatory factor (Ser/Thr protein kinase)
VLLRQEGGDGLSVIAVAGPVTSADTVRLAAAVENALTSRSGGVVVDLRDVTSLAPEARLALQQGYAAAADGAACLRLRLDVDAGPHGPSQARRAVAQCASRLGLEEEGDDLLLLVSEMVTNAVRHGAPPVRLEVAADDDLVRVAVDDADPRLPQARRPGVDAEGGRGMVLVDELSCEHGVQPQPPGKSVWAAVRRSPGSRP